MNLILANTHTVHEFNGLYSLNDLHQASGGADKHKPSNFLRNQEAQDLITELESEKQIAYHAINGGNNRGTYACRELVYRYAMWISPKFSLMVIRAFDALNTGAIPCLDRPCLSDFQAFTLQQAVKAKCGGNRSHYQALYRTLYNAFGVNSYKNILADDFDEAMAIVAEFNPNPIPAIDPQKLYDTFAECALRLQEFCGVLGQLDNMGYTQQNKQYHHSFNRPISPPAKAHNLLVELVNALGLRNKHGSPMFINNHIHWYDGKTTPYACQ